jgi:mRNA-degrading endonuclease RelE of RelBE toxin-antitoxin system
MNPALVERPEFQNEIKRLSRKFRHIENDLQDFYKEFLSAPLVRAFAIPGFERKLWKVRMKSADQQRGKSGGFRLIFYFDENKPVALQMLTLYPKTERADISSDELQRLLKDVMSKVLQEGNQSKSPE